MKTQNIVYLNGLWYKDVQDALKGEGGVDDLVFFDGSYYFDKSDAFEGKNGITNSEFKSYKEKVNSLEEAMEVINNLNKKVYTLQKIVSSKDFINNELDKLFGKLQQSEEEKLLEKTLLSISNVVDEYLNKQQNNNNIESIDINKAQILSKSTTEFGKNSDNKEGDVKLYSGGAQAVYIDTKDILFPENSNNNTENDEDFGMSIVFCDKCHKNVALTGCVHNPDHGNNDF